MRTLIVLAALIPLVYSCATLSTPVVRKDPLIGKIIDTSTGQPVSYDHLLDTLAGYDMVYLSEKHNNPMHHAIQQRIISDIADAGRAAAVGFEFFSVQDTPQLLSLMDSKQARHSPEMEKAVEKQMRAQLNWEDQTDEMWSFYWQLLTLARDKGLTAAGLDLVSAQKRRITRKGLEGISILEKNQLKGQLFSPGTLSPAYKQRMTDLFNDVHCGMTLAGKDHGNKITDRLFDTWMARNDRMALSLVELCQAVQQTPAPDKKKGPVIVIMGNGHTEYNLGVMDRVRHLNPGISQVNLAITEISREPSALDDYLTPLDLEGYPPSPPADFIWFTQRVSYEDPCQKFRQALERMTHQKRKD